MRARRSSRLPRTVTALARRAPIRPARDRIGRVFAGFAGAVAAAIAPGGPAGAQVSTELTLQSDYRVRGYSLSDEKPALTLTVGYDDRSGFFAGGAATAIWADGSPRLLGAFGYVGYAVRLSRTVSADGGILQTRYTDDAAFGRTIDYTEMFVGISTPPLSAHLFFSPDYYETGLASLYGQVRGSLEIAPDVTLNADVGHLVYLEQPANYHIPQRLDWRLAAAHQFGRANAFVALSGRIVRSDNQDTAVVIGLSRSF